MEKKILRRAAVASRGPSARRDVARSLCITWHRAVSLHALASRGSFARCLHFGHCLYEHQNTSGCSQDLEVGGHKGSGDGSFPAMCTGRAPGGRFWGQEPPKAHSILWIFCCQTMHYFVYLARLHEPLAKHEKNVVSAAKSLSSSHRESFRGGLSPRVAKP